MKNKTVIIAFFLSGMSALIYEVTWIRPIGLVYDSTIFVVSAITASLMGGLAFGSLLAGLFIDKVKKPLYAYAIFELVIGIYGLLLIELFKILPSINMQLINMTSPLKYNLVLFGSVFALLLIPATLMGATFPTVAKAYVTEKIGKGIGELYSANNIGAIIGSLLAGFVLIPALGIKWTIVLAAFLNISAAFLVLFTFYRSSIKAVVACTIIVFAYLIFSSDYNITNLYSRGPFGLNSENYLGEKKIVFYKEGLYGSVVVFRETPTSPIYHLLLNGQGSSSLRLSDMRVSSLLGYLPRLLKPESSNAMAIGFGIGGTARALSRQFDTTTVEIEPEVINAAPYFGSANAGVLSDPKHHLVFDDARDFLETTQQKFDAVVNHPLDPHKSYSSLLFTKEFLELIKSRLNPGGIYVHWTPTYYLSMEDFKDFYYTFKSVFPYQVCFINIKKGEQRGDLAVSENGRELILVGSLEPINLDMAKLQAGYDKLPEQDKAFLSHILMKSPQDIYNLLIFKGEDMEGYDAGAHLITDDLPRLEFSTVLNKITNKSGRQQVVDSIVKYVKNK